MKKKEIKNEREIYFKFVKQLRSYKKKILKEDIGLFIRKFTAKILWYFCIFLIYLVCIHKFIPDVNSIFPYGIGLFFTAIVSFISLLTKDKFLFFISGGFFDNFSIHLLNKFILLLLLLIFGIGLLSKFITLKLLNKNEK